MASCNKILIIEDDKGLCDLIATQLEEKGFVCETAYNSKSAVLKIKEREFDLLLIDYHLGSVTLKEFLEGLEEEEISLPFIAITGYGGERLAVDIMKRGARDFVVKDDTFFDLLVESVVRVQQQLEAEKEAVQARMALRRSQQRLSNLVSQSLDPAFIVDLNGNAIDTNTAFKKLFGSIGSSDNAQTFFSLFAAGSTARELKDELHTERQVKNFSARMIDKDGNHCECLINALLFNDENDFIAGYQGFIKEISEIKKMELLLKENQDQLERKNMELQQVVQSLKTFSDSISNDLRTPIWRLNGYCQVLEDNLEDDSEAAGVVHQIRKDGQRITQFINDAFRLSSITRSQVNRERVDLSQIANEIFSELQVEGGQRSIEYRVQEDIIVNADQRLVLIMMRLLLYYVWFYSQVCMGETISLETVEEEETVCLRISGDDLERITNNELFVPLYQAYLIKDYFQTGLSLVTVQRVMSLHGGRIWIDRSDGQLELRFTFQ